MNRSSVLGRKIIYLLILVGMLVPLYLLGQPAGGGDSGGTLSQMRDSFNIAESDLGEISPASETMKLASLGLRGVAASLLWNKAHEYKVNHEWDRLKAALNNIALLQPHYDKVWEHQAHNLAYNVSTEFDDYRQRYEMVREGTEFLTRGVRQNRNAPRLIWYTGWFYGSKMGMSDEKVQFRRLFSEDERLHESLMEEGIPVDSPDARGPNGPDNWLVGRLWLFHGYDLVDSGVQIRRQTPLNFYETGPKWRLKFAESIEKEGILDDRAVDAWQRASQDWEDFGNRSIPTTARFTIKLGQLEELNRQRDEKITQLRELATETYDEMLGNAVKALPQYMREAWNKSPEERTEEEIDLIPTIKERVEPDLDQVAKSSKPAVRLKAVELVDEINDLSERILKTNGYRNQINYPFWESLAQAEQEERTVRARRLIYEAEEANGNAELDKAIDLYEQAFAIWADIFDDYPILTIDDSSIDLYESIRRYTIAIDSEELPEDFPLLAFVQVMGDDGRVDSQQYEQVRRQQKELLRKRKQELAEEERRREQKIAEEEAAKKAAKEQEADDDEAMKKASPERDDAESKVDGAESKDVDSDSDAENGKQAEDKKDADQDSGEPEKDGKPEKQSEKNDKKKAEQDTQNNDDADQS
tara:strand:- start:87211 stop:89139 length:1929 start_codon:yes stop_codon:yes gene_type:complete